MYPGASRKPKLVALTEEVQSSFRDFLNGDFGGGQDGGKKLAERFFDIGEQLELLATGVASDASLEASEKEIGLYYLHMEAALSYYWAGRVLGSTESDVDPAERADECFSKSLSVYSKLALDPKYAHDAILAYRMANVLTAQNQSELALVKLREAAKEIETHDQPNLREDHFLRVRIPRQLGVAYWEKPQVKCARSQALMEM